MSLDGDAAVKISVQSEGWYQVSKGQLVAAGLDTNADARTLQLYAEGIEQPRQLTALREMGCGYGQGFLVARPMAAPGVEALIRTGVASEAAVVSACETSPAVS